MKKIKKIVISISVFVTMCLIFLLPGITLAEEAQGNVGTGITYECGTQTTTVNDQKVTIYGNCTFNDLISATQKAVKYLVEFALGLSVVVLAYAGFKYMTSGGSPGARTEAKKMLTNWVKGVALILGAWLIVTLITNALLKDTVKNAIPLGKN